MNTDTSSIFKTVDNSVEHLYARKDYQITLLMLERIEKERGRLSNRFKFYRVNALYELGYFNESLHFNRMYQLEGIFLKELHFLSGLCHYQLKEWQLALDDFMYDSEWERWRTKAQYMIDEKQGNVKPIIVGNQTESSELSFDPDWYQTALYVVITLPIKGVNQDSLTVKFLPNAIDICIKNRFAKVFKASIELFAEINPKRCDVKVTPSKIELKCEKVVSAMWSKYDFEGTDPLQSKSGLTQIASQITTPYVSDEEALESFEEHMSDIERKMNTDI